MSAAGTSVNEPSTGDGGGYSPLPAPEGQSADRARLRTARATGALLTAIAVAAATVLLPVTPAGAVEKPAGIDVIRHGGADRYATSLVVAEAVAADAGGRLDWVVMVSGRNWTDAVVAAPLAGSLGAPVLTTPPGTLRADAAEFLQRTGVSRALIVGADSDTAGVGPSVAAALEILGISVERVTRADQYLTSVAAARRLGEPGGMGTLGRTAIVASGEVFADALVAGAFAARGPHPVLLTPRNRLHQEVSDFLAQAGVEHVVVMGGAGALQQPVEDSLSGLGVEVTRLTGATRYDTAVKAARLAFRSYTPSCFTNRRVGLARARVPFDSFSAAPLLARLCAPLLLTDPAAIPSETTAYLDDARATFHASSTDKLAAHVFGGDAAVSQAAIETYLSGPASTGVQCRFDFSEGPIAVLDGIREEWPFPSWSPDCTRIAYVSDGHIWTSRVDGAGKSRLAEGHYPDWSPDGSRIAYTRRTGEVVVDAWTKEETHVQHVRVINVDGSGDTQLTSAKHSDTAPKWSPDGRRLLFRRKNLTDQFDPQDLLAKDEYLVIINADGRNERDLDQGAWLPHSHEWTPDGKRVSVSGGDLIWTALDDGSDDEAIWAVRNTGYGHWAWSPDGCSMALTTKRRLESGEFETALKIVDIASGALTTVVSYTGPLSVFADIHHPRWTPDGRGILINTDIFDSVYAAPRMYVVEVPAK